MSRSSTTKRRFNDEYSEKQQVRTGALVSEPNAWAAVSGLADQALTFWNGFLGLRSGSNVLDVSQLARLTTIIRAVSWVESQHGTGADASASKDPMQCGNPADAWWKELTNCAGAQDRFVRGPGLTPNYNACELPDAAAKAGSFPQNAGVSQLGSKPAGHNDGNFTRLISYVWGVPFLLFKINKTAGDNAYQCGDLSRARLADGAVAYNGGGDPDYRDKINAALDMIGGLGPAELEFSMPRRTDAQTIIDYCEQEFPATKDDCNKFVKAVSADLGVTLFQPGDDADAIVQRMRDASWSRLADGVDAKGKADSGIYVFAGLKGADHNPPRDHGHVAVVVSGPLAAGKYPTGYWGSLGGAPGKDKTLNYAWNQADRDNVEYYAQVGSLESLVAAGAVGREQGVRDATTYIMREIATQLNQQDPGRRVLFPNGVNLIELSVEIAPAKVTLKIAGEKAT